MRLAVIGGDGVGSELASLIGGWVERCMGWEVCFVNAGYAHFTRTNSNIGTKEFESIEQCDGILFGATASPRSRAVGYMSPILQLRHHYELYANIRPVKTRCRGGRRVDVVLIRENIEGLYAGRERMENAETAIAERVVSEPVIRRLARFALDYAVKNGRRKITLVHKSNVLTVSDGLFREVCLSEASQQHHIEVDEQLVDAAGYHIVRHPEQFDVILTTNMYGDILSDVLAAVSDGIGFAPSLSIGVRMGLAEPIHGSAPDIAGKGTANPYGMLFSLAMLSEWMGCSIASKRLVCLAEAMIAEGVLTPDAGGACRTQEVIEELERRWTNDSRVASEHLESVG